MKKYKFIFWDMDGTLANTYEGVTNCVKYAMEPYGIHLEGEEELRKFIGPPLRFSFTTYCGLSEEEAEKAIVRYRERYIPIGVFRLSKKQDTFRSSHHPSRRHSAARCWKNLICCQN